LTIHSEREGRAHILQPVGELDLDTVGEFENELRRVEATDVPEIRVDLSRVESIDSDGLKLFINASARCRARAGRLKLVRGPDAVHRAFQTTGLESRLPFADRQVPTLTDASAPR
jgi:anti-sigma B factor antagonist